MKQSKPKTKKKSAAVKAITQKTSKPKKKMISKKTRKRMVKSMLEATPTIMAGAVGGTMKKISKRAPTMIKKSKYKKKK